MSDRVYSLCEGYRENRKVIRWGVSRYGRKHDVGMQEAVCVGQELGRQSLYIEWTPRTPKQRSPEQMREHRLRNMRKRIERKFPLFAEQFIHEQLKRDKFDLNACKADHEARTRLIAESNASWWAAHPEERRVRLPNAQVEFQEGSEE